MATGTLYLRPNRDISFNHLISPDTLTAGYLAINERVCDEGSTYICTRRTKVSTEANLNNAISEFGLGMDNLDGEFVKRIVSISNVKYGVYIGANLSSNGKASWAVTFKCNGASDTLEINTQKDVDFELYCLELTNVKSAIINHFNSYGVIPEVTVEINTSSSMSDADKSGETETRVSQVFIEIVCEYIGNVYTKRSGAFVPARNAFKKLNGTWVGLSSSECKSLLNSFILDKCKYRGHLVEELPGRVEPTCNTDGIGNGEWCRFCGEIYREHEVLPATGIHKETALASTATCTEDGMTGGITCLECGQILKEHDTVQPALGHTYNSATGACVRSCGQYHPDAVTFTIQRNTQTSAVTWHAMPNLTWGEWVGGQGDIFARWQITANGSVRYYSAILGTATDFTIDGVKSTDLIIAGHAYTATDAT